MQADIRGLYQVAHREAYRRGESGGFFQVCHTRHRREASLEGGGAETPYNAITLLYLLENEPTEEYAAFLFRV